MTQRLHPHPSNPKLWGSYVDVLDQTIKAGDYVAYASISGRSPQMVIARVVQINRVNSSGEAIKGDYGNNKVSCTIKLQPFLDARGFGRYTDRAVTIKIPNNVIKINWKPPTEGE